MKQTILILFLLISVGQSFAQKLDSTALILIDIQYFYFPEGAVELEAPEAAATNAQKILEYFREKNALVVHVRHEFEPGGDIHELVKPIEGEQVFSKKEVNSFLGTGLNQYLQSHGIKNLVLAGMQTHMCLEGATRAAHDLGYQCTVIADACATRNLTFNNRTVLAADVHASTLASLKSYAKIVTIDEYQK